MSADLDAVVGAYFALGRGPHRDDDPNWWAWEAVNDILMDDAEAGWELVLRLIREAPDDDILSYVAAGPLEEFLQWYGDEFCDRILDAVRSDPAVRRATNHAILSELPTKLTDGLRVLLGDRPDFD